MKLEQRGFTLIEMATVIAIVGFFVVSVIAVTKSVQLGTGVQLTNNRLDRIQRALQVYVAQHACLPCPATGATASTVATAGHAQAGGTYVTTTNFCTATACDILTVGVVPWLDLGLSEQDITDGWGGRIRYALGGTPCGGAAHVQTTGGMNGCGVGTGSNPTNGLNVADFDTTTPLLAASNTTVVTAVYVLISSGPDRSLQNAATSGTLSTNVFSQNTSTDGQGLNSAGTTVTINGNAFPTFARGSLNASQTTSHFDDIVRFTSASTIIYNCGPGACGNPS